MAPSPNAEALPGIFPSPLDDPLLYVACINIHALSQRLQLDAAKRVGLANVFRVYDWMMGSRANWGPSGNLPKQGSVFLSVWK